MKTKSHPLPLGRVLLYSMASAGINLVGITAGTWILYFYAPPPGSGRVQYLPVALVGVLMTIVSLWDAIIDPFIGHYSDNLHSRWGRRRPFLIFGAPAMALLVILIWTPPGRSVWVNALYLLLITAAFHTAISLIGIPYDATMPEMAPESQPRVILSYWKNVFGLLGVLVGALVAAPLFSTLGPVAMGAVAGFVGLVTVWLALLGLREAAPHPTKSLGPVEGILITLRNRQFIFIFISTLFIHIAYQMLVADLPYFVTLVVREGESQVSIFQAVLIVMMALTGPVWAWWNKKLPQRKLLNITIFSLAVTSFLGVLVGLIPGVAVMTQSLALFALTGVALGGYFIMAYAIMGNVVDYDEMLTGRRREAIYYGTFSFANGLGASMGTLILPILLDAFGYSQQNPTGVRMAFPAMSLCLLLGFLVFQKYRLGDTPQETRRIMNLPEVSNDQSKL